MGLLDKLLGRETKPDADQPAAVAAESAAPSDAALTQRDDETSPHHHAEQEADA